MRGSCSAAATCSRREPRRRPSRPTLACGFRRLLAGLAIFRRAAGGALWPRRSARCLSRSRPHLGRRQPGARGRGGLVRAAPGPRADPRPHPRGRHGLVAEEGAIAAIQAAFSQAKAEALPGRRRCGCWSPAPRCFARDAARAIRQRRAADLDRLDPVGHCAFGMALPLALGDRRHRGADPAQHRRRRFSPCRSAFGFVHGVALGFGMTDAGRHGRLPGAADRPSQARRAGRGDPAADRPGLRAGGRDRVAGADGHAVLRVCRAWRSSACSRSWACSPRPRRRAGCCRR